MSFKLERRILVLAPTKRDAALTCAMLKRKGIDCESFDDVDALVGEMQRGVGAILIAEEIVKAGRSEQIEDAIAHQPPWSDLPVLLITGQGADSAAAAVALKSLGNVMLIERPTRVTA